MKRLIRDYSPTLAFAAAAFFVFHPILLAPRFWAEEGAIYFVRLREMDLPSALIFTANANLQLLLNALVYVASAVPTEYAAHVTTYGSCLLLLSVAAQLNTLALERGAPQWLTALGLIAWASLPTNIEIFFTATNLQWLLGISIAAMSIQNVGALGKWAFAALCVYVAVAGLTGLASCLALPLFAIRYFARRERAVFVLMAVLGLCACIQAINIVFGDTSNRILVFSARLLSAPTILQTVYLPIFGVDVTNAMADVSRHSRLGALQVVLPGLAFAGAVWTAAFASSKEKLPIGLLCFGWSFISIMQTFGSIGAIDDKVALISALGGGRYFATGQVMLVLGLVLMGRQQRFRFAAGAYFAIVVAVCLPYTQHMIGQSSTTRPAWAKAVENCASFPCTVGIWPQGWSVELTHR